MRRIVLTLAACALGLSHPLAAQATEGIADLVPWRLLEANLDVDLRDPTAMRASGTLLLSPTEEQDRGLLAIEKPAEFERLTTAQSGVSVDVLDGALIGADDFWLGLIDMSAASERPDEVELVFEVGHPGGEYLAFRESGIALLHTTTAWWPTPGGGDRGAPGRTVVRVPTGWRALSGGEPVRSELRSDGRVEEFVVREASGRSVIAGLFDVTTSEGAGHTISTYLLPGTRVAAGAVIAGVDSILMATTPHLGPYPYRHVAVAEVPDRVRGWLGVSGEGFVAVQQWLMPGELGYNIAMLAHELGHGFWRSGQWRGKNGLMIGEALSQYTAVVAIEGILGRRSAVEFLEFSTENYPDQSARGYFEISRMGQDRALGSLAGGGRDHDLADSKGIWVYDMLRRRVGDDAFFATLRTLRSDGAFSRGEVGLGELLGAWQTAAPEVDLEPFFSEWIDRPGAPVVSAEVAEREADRGLLCLRQLGPVYTLDLEVSVAGGAVRRLTMGAEEVCEWFGGLSEPVQVQLDPGREYLIWRPSYGPPPPTRVGNGAG